MPIGLPFAEIPQDFKALDIPAPRLPFKTHFTKEEILAPYQPYAKPPVVPEVTAWVLLAAFAPMACVLAAEPLWTALRARKRPQYALRHLLVLSIALAGTLLGAWAFGRQMRSKELLLLFLHGRRSSRFSIAGTLWSRAIGLRMIRRCGSYPFSFETRRNSGMSVPIIAIGAHALSNPHGSLTGKTAWTSMCWS